MRCSRRSIERKPAVGEGKGEKRPAREGEEKEQRITESNASEGRDKGGERGGFRKVFCPKNLEYIYSGRRR